jgi:hypothetical protein
MKRWMALAFLLLFLSGCSFSRIWKYIDEMEYERDDQTIRVVRFLMK